MEDEKGVPIVIDNGSGIIKTGLSGGDQPQKFPSLVGRQSNQNSTNIVLGKDILSAKRETLKITHPIERGIITSWEDTEKIWHHCFNKLNISPKDRPTLLTQVPRHPKKNRQRITETMFQTFEVPAYYLAFQGLLSLYSSGRTTGINVSIGDGVAQVVPIIEGTVISQAIQMSDLAGRDLTENMKRLVGEKGINCSSYDESVFMEMKEKLCYVAFDYENELNSFRQSGAKNKTYDLPDGQKVSLGSEMITCSEALFNPGKLMPGIHQLTFQSIQKCDYEIRKDLYRSIVVNGGTTLLPGMVERSNKQIIGLAPSTMKVNIVAISEKERAVATWLGGSILSSLQTFQNKWITKAEYQETGPSIVHRKCD